MEKQAEKKSKRAPLLIVLCLLALTLSVGVYFWNQSMHYETTDDAQIKGNIYSIRTGITAYLDTICFKDNQRVEKGDTLFVFRTESLKAQVEIAKAALANAKSGLSVSDLNALASEQEVSVAQQNKLSTQSQIDIAQAKLTKATENFDRDKQLIDINGITQQQYETDKSLLAQAEATLQQTIHQSASATRKTESIRSQSKVAHQQISSAAALVMKCESELTIANERLHRAYIIAPCSGTVTKRSVEAGQYVLEGQSLCMVIDESNLWVTANFKETQLSNIKPGQKVQLSVDAYPDLVLNGLVDSYSGATSSSFALIPADNATGNYIKVTQRFPLRISITDYAENSNQADHHRSNNINLFPGLSVFVKIRTN